MSLALAVDAARCDATRRVAAVIGALLFAALLLAALEQFLSGPQGARWWLPLACALVCGAWCLMQCRRSACRPRYRLRVSNDGKLCLLAADSGESHDAVLAGAWCLSSLIWLRVSASAKVDPDRSDANDPQSASCFKSGDYGFMLARASFDEATWHGLRRWLLWHRRSRRSAVVTA
jgi:hypothetical protein